jgi:SAM-dependent methyltransferase
MAQSTLADTEFPRDLLDLLRCSRDGGELAIRREIQGGQTGIVEADLSCQTCGSEYLVKDGIARLVVGDLSPEDEHETSLRDSEYSIPSHNSPCSRSELSDLIEIPPFLKALSLLENCVVMEVGCGDGRFSLLMAQHGARILAIDLSINALHALAGRLVTGRAPTPFPQNVQTMRDFRPRVGLVHADASRIRLAPRSVNRALSTTPLDSREQRMALYSSIADALADDGWFVGSVEHDDLFRRSLGLPTARRYERGGIFIEHFDSAKIRRETAPYFKKVKTWPIRPRVPHVWRLPPKVGARVSTTFGSLPILRQVGEILLFRADHPVRQEIEDAHRPGNRLAKSVFGWYSWCVGKQPIWDREPVKID